MWDLVDGMDCGLETWVMQTKQEYMASKPRIGSATLDGTVFLAPGWEDGFLRQDAIEQR
jgi:hypothetical protein